MACMAECIDSVGAPGITLREHLRSGISQRALHIVHL